MESGLVELTACLASLDSLLSKARRLVKEYDAKVRKMGYPPGATESLENIIAFSEIRSLDELCTDALRRWLPFRPELANQWKINENKDLSSVEEVEFELFSKRSRLSYAIELYKASSQAEPSAPDMPSAYRKLGDTIRLFFSDSRNQCEVFDRNVFIMTSFQRGNPQLEMIDKTIRASLRAAGLVGHRADDRSYPSDRNLWDNVCVYMFGCKFGIAVLDNLVADEFNPNVALEYGFMRALGKPALLLKEKRFAPRADVLGTLWEEFDMFDIEKTVATAIHRWLRDIQVGTE